MKKKLLFTLSLLLAVNIINAQDFSIDGVNYTITDQTVEIATGSCYDGELVLTEQIENDGNTYTLTSIAEEAFGGFSVGCETLTDVTIPNTVTAIGRSAFRNCTNLTTVTIGNGLTSIDKYAFASLPSLTTFSIDVVEPIYIGFQYVFDDVDIGTVTLEVPSGSESAYAVAPVWKAFSIYGNFTIDGINYLIKDPTTNIVEVVSGSCYDGDLILSETVMDSNITYTITTIGEAAFGGDNACETLTSLTLPDSVTQIGQNAFSYCTNLEHVTFGNAIEIIGNNIFNSSSNLTSISIGLVEPLDISNFSVFGGLDTTMVALKVPEDAQAAYEAADVWMDFLIYSTNFTVDGINYLITDEDNNYVEVYYGSCYDGDLVLTETVEYGGQTYTLKAIGEYAFGYYYSESIEACDTLTGIEIPDSVTSIGYSSFYDCAALTNVSMGNSIESIIPYAFTNVPLENFTINVENPINVSSVAFDGVTLSNVTLIVPEGSEDAYSSSTTWEDFGTIENILSVSDNELSENDFSIYINEYQEQLIVNTAEVIKDIVIYNISGQQVINESSNLINVSNLNSGIYIIKISSDKGYYTKKVVKK